MASKKARPVAEIRADLARNRARVADSLGDFVEEVHPKNIAKRGIDEAKGFVADEFKAAKAQVKDANGWRTDRLLAIGGAVLGVVVFAVTLNVVAGRRTRSVQAQVRKALEATR
ncbi:DUF3618 domain-containing protein [Tessaracoccus rhinocerotis]|uniref:DUF3618 domain-containing protein n=1 Tax=Tessaracoccus rhinocerotis TaxID=1689449 RepID=A0A553K4W9_9ACTN|nr:DUF3618 domain-containing protein [Tessaracoccus rhinocerotis]TRY19744.1 DUF3618 domain-containing protein [Tessaracoccus rhinocerotis]